MSDTNPVENTNTANKKLESGAEHAKKALGAATEAGKNVSETVKKEAQSAYGTGKEHLSAAARDLSEAAQAKYEEFRGQATEKAGQYRERAQAALSEAQVRAQGFQEETEDYIRANPLQSIGIAVGIGFILGVIFRR